MNTAMNTAVGNAIHDTTQHATGQHATGQVARHATHQDRRYLAPDWATRTIVNPLMTAFVKLGLPIRGARELQVRGRTSGKWRTVPVNPLTVDGQRYLVAPRGQTQWVRNLRAAGEGRLRTGRRVEEFSAVEVADADKGPIIRAYLREWAFEVGRFFEGITADSTHDEIAAVAADFPVFRISA